MSKEEYIPSFRYAAVLCIAQSRCVRGISALLNSLKLSLSPLGRARAEPPRRGLDLEGEFSGLRPPARCGALKVGLPAAFSGILRRGPNPSHVALWYASTVGRCTRPPRGRERREPLPRARERDRAVRGRRDQRRRGDSQGQNPSTRTNTHWTLHSEASRLWTVLIFSASLSFVCQLCDVSGCLQLFY